jgi:hypothetical protein
MLQLGTLLFQNAGALGIFTSETLKTFEMKTENHHNEKWQRAKESVEKLKGFYTHLLIYLIAVPVFVWLNVRSSSNFPWALFPILGWGLGILGHASEVYAVNFFYGRKWEERKIKQFMEEQS